jgi:hypothetical protein
MLLALIKIWLAGLGLVLDRSSPKRQNDKSLFITLEKQYGSHDALCSRSPTASSRKLEKKIAIVHNS